MLYVYMDGTDTQHTHGMSRLQNYSVNFLRSLYNNILFTFKHIHDCMERYIHCIYIYTAGCKKKYESM